MNNYLYHLKRQFKHQVQAPLAIRAHFVLAIRSICEVVGRLLSIPFLLIAPVLALFALMDERDLARKSPDAGRRVRERIASFAQSFSQR